MSDENYTTTFPISEWLILVQNLRKPIEIFPNLRNTYFGAVATL